MNPTEQPAWFDSALAETRRNYRRIDVSKHTCELCGTKVHVATDPNTGRRIPSPTPEHPARYTMTVIPAVYAFCSCAQWLGHPGKKSWEELAAIYHQKIALPNSVRHRANMLRGFPTTAFIGLWSGD